MVAVAAAQQHAPDPSQDALQEDLLRWLGARPRDPKALFLVHGEPDAADDLRRRAQEDVSFPVHVPEHGEVFDLATPSSRPA